MKIAITGHSQGIGKELARIYAEQGHEIIGLSRSNGHNIKSVPKIATEIEPADIFINNAQAGYAQTDLLFDVFQRWIAEPKKQIIVVSTHMTRMPVNPIPGFDMDEYRVQKVALEEACMQLRHSKKGPRIILVRPGAVNTQFHDEPRPGMADPAVWAETLVKILDSAGPDLWIPEISLVPFRKQ